MPSNDFHVKIAVAGEGGQGVQLIGELLSETAFRQNLQSIYIPNFGVEQRGGVSIAFVQISSTEIGSPKFRIADHLAVLSQRSIERTKHHADSGTTFIYDSSSIVPPKVDDRAVGRQCFETVAPEAFSEMVGTVEGDPMKVPEYLGGKHIAVPASEIAKTELSPRVANIIILGVLVELAGVLSVDKVMEAMEYRLRDKFDRKPELRDLNRSALERGIEIARKGGQE